MMEALHDLAPDELRTLSKKTLQHYATYAESFWNSTQDHDVTQNIDALLGCIEHEPPLSILDFGCGPGRDLVSFSRLGHNAIGVDGCKVFVDMARRYTQCKVWHQNFLHLQLPVLFFDGIFANASMFHVPTQELPRVLRELYLSLKPSGVLFCSNPRGDNIEHFSAGRYCSFLEHETWRAYVIEAGFDELDYYYRPKDKPCSQQPWLATLWRRPEI
ncbi:MAG: SAM-dependent methyltransferase [Acidiferrobacteraceae bacterium]|nr:SAM-dependent methyltransferase [Acidiferrobacteraceae bacterium]|tara:strand:+ start:1420 stop:2067 length:648 start_codon:yes stop_codon:yes gene_type:complete